MIWPDGMQVQEWTDKTTLILEKYGAVSRLDDPDRWQDWAARAISLVGLQGNNCPNPYQFDDWRSWAERFNQTTQIEG